MIFPVSRLSVETDQYLIRSIRVSPNPELRLASCKSRNRSMRTTIRRRPAGRLFVQSESKRITIRKGGKERPRAHVGRGLRQGSSARGGARRTQRVHPFHLITSHTDSSTPTTRPDGNWRPRPHASHKLLHCIALHPRPGWSRTARRTPSRRASTGHPARVRVSPHVTAGSGSRTKAREPATRSQRRKRGKGSRI